MKRKVLTTWNWWRRGQIGCVLQTRWSQHLHPLVPHNEYRIQCWSICLSLVSTGMSRISQSKDDEVSWITIPYFHVLIFKLAECTQCYCGEIRQVLIFLLDLYCLKAYHRPDHSIRIVECHRKIIIIIPKPNIFVDTRIQDSFRVCDSGSSNHIAETNNFVLCTVLSCLVSELLKSSSSGLEPRTVVRDCRLCFCNLLFETNNIDIGAFFYRA
jgi:hypothetical protein